MTVFLELRQSAGDYFRRKPACTFRVPSTHRLTALGGSRRKHNRHATVSRWCDAGEASGRAQEYPRGKPDGSWMKYLEEDLMAITIEADGWVWLHLGRWLRTTTMWLREARR